MPIQAMWTTVLVMWLEALLIILHALRRPALLFIAVPLAVTLCVLFGLARHMASVIALIAPRLYVSPLIVDGSNVSLGSSRQTTRHPSGTRVSRYFRRQQYQEVGMEKGTSTVLERV